MLNSNDWQGLEELAIDLHGNEDLVEEFSDTDNRVLSEMGTELRQDRGARLASERTRLSPARPSMSAEILTRHFKKLSPSALKTMLAALTEARSHLHEDVGGGNANPVDPLDCHYAKEMVQKLEMIVDRAARLSRMPIEAVPGMEVQRYFQEAHDCYLYGFEVASAVLCRAILESALEDLIPPESRNGETVVGMVHLAKDHGLLSDERASWAEEVYSAGNAAIHGYDRFRRRYPADRLEDLFLKARAVAEELYSRKE